MPWIDLYAGGRFFTNNNEFRGNNQLSESELGVLTVHYSHNIGKRMWASISVHYDNVVNRSSITFRSTIMQTTFGPPRLSVRRSGSSGWSCATKTRHRSRTLRPRTGWYRSGSPAPFTHFDLPLKGARTWNRGAPRNAKKSMPN